MEQATLKTSPMRVPWKWGVYLVVGLLLIGWWLNTPPGILGKADAVGYAVCHRIDLRSFHLGDRQLPLCVRCSGMYLGAMLGLGYHIVAGRRKAGLPPNRVVAILSLLGLAFAVDGLNSYLHLDQMITLFPALPRLYQPSHVLRLGTGSGMGLAIAVFLMPAFNQTMWADWTPQPAVGGWRSLGGLLALAALLDALVLTESPVVLYPLALISAAGVLVLLTLVYTMLVVMFFRRDNTHLSWRQLFLPLAAGFGIALAQTAVIDWLRFLFTQTWLGFPM